MNSDLRTLFLVEAQAVLDAGSVVLSERFETMAFKLAALESGKLLVTGVGKSAIAARKIAATMATCTVPAIFIDPIGLFHGELGAITGKDIALLISHSGETEELIRLMPHLGKRGVDVMAIVGNQESVLGRLPLSLNTRVTVEAYARIPTASFAATVAVGDALAVRSAQLRGVDRRELARHHPGGTIGLQEAL